MLPFSNAPLAVLEAEDFRRLGLRRYEYRPLMIRRALGRLSVPFVVADLRGPTVEGRLELARLLVSGYRLIDPRRRDDAMQRAVLGRLHLQLLEESLRLGPVRVFGVGGADRVGVPRAAGATGGTGGLFGAGGGVVAGGVSRGAGEFAAESATGPLALGGAPGEPSEELSEERVATLAGLTDDVPEWSESFLQPEDHDGWWAVLGTADWTVPAAEAGPLVGGWDWPGIRARVLAASPVLRWSIALLAASILLVMTWRTMVWWRRSGGVPDVIVTFDPEPLPGSGQADGADDEDWGQLEMLSGGATGAGGAGLAANDPLVVDPLEADEFTLDSLVKDPFAAVPMGVEPILLDSFSEELFREPSPMPVDRERNGSGQPNAEGLGAPGEPVRFPTTAEVAAVRASVDRKALDRTNAVGSASEAYRQVAKESEVGSAEAWAAWLGAVQVAVLASDYRQVDKLVSELSMESSAETEEVWRQVAGAVVRQTRGSESVPVVFRWLDRGLRRAWSDGDAVLAEVLFEAMQSLAGRSRDQLISGELREWREVMALAGRYHERFGEDWEAAEEALAEASGEERLLFGRYWALVRRDWDRGLPSLAEGERGRLPRLAAAELMAGAGWASDEAVRVADGYQLEAGRQRGWLAESLIRRAHEVLVRAAAGASTETAKLDLTRRAEQVRAAHPRAFEEEGLGP